MTTSTIQPPSWALRIDISLSQDRLCNTCSVFQSRLAKEHNHEDSDSRGPRGPAGPGDPPKGRLQDSGASQATSADSAAAVTYEHLATAIIEIEATEDNLVKSILIGYHQAAQHHLRRAADDAAQRQTHLEAAATEITNIANEGDKRIQAVRQRLKKAGHTHNTDVVTKEDFMFIDSKEKKQLLDFGQKVARLGAGASADDIRAVHDELTQLVEKAIAEQ